MGPGCRGAEAVVMCALREAVSAVVLPMRVTFLPVRLESGREASLKGGLRRPTFGLMRNFWFEGGIESSEATLSERSVMVASWAKARVMGLPWCVRVSSMSEAGVGVSIRAS